MALFWKPCGPGKAMAQLMETLWARGGDGPALETLWARRDEDPFLETLWARRGDDPFLKTLWAREGDGPALETLGVSIVTAFLYPCRLDEGVLGTKSTCNGRKYICW